MLAQVYEDQQEEAELLDALELEIAAIEQDIGRDLTPIEIDGIVDRVEETGESPTEFAHDGYIADLGNAEDRTTVMADMGSDPSSAAAESIAHNCDTATVEWSARKKTPTN
jgi:hypothetical protein